MNLIIYQIFSKPMADDIKFYKDNNYAGFNDCGETIQFTRKMNYLFDAMNRKFHAEEISPNSHNIEVSYVFIVACCMLNVQFHGGIF